MEVPKNKIITSGNWQLNPVLADIRNNKPFVPVNLNEAGTNIRNSAWVDAHGNAIFEAITCAKGLWYDYLKNSTPRLRFTQLTDTQIMENDLYVVLFGRILDFTRGGYRYIFDCTDIIWTGQDATLQGQATSSKADFQNIHSKIINIYTNEVVYSNENSAIDYKYTNATSFEHKHDADFLIFGIKTESATNELIRPIDRFVLACIPLEKFCILALPQFQALKYRINTELVYPDEMKFTSETANEIFDLPFFDSYSNKIKQ